jgi:hypothetical protein
MDIVKSIYAPWTKRAAHRTLAGRVRDRRTPENGRFTKGNVDGLLERAWRRYEGAAADLPPEPTMGSRMNVRLACFTVSFFEELLAIGVERAYAIELIADACWSIYRTWAIVAAKVAKLSGRASALGFAATTRGGGPVSLRFPFNAPGYRIETVPAKRGTAFDVVHCPVATYFRERGAPDLCVASWCNLDYPLGEITNQKLVRTKTLVEGADRCNFRIVPLNGPQ